VRTTYSYDDANRLLSETTPQGVVSYTYNRASQKLTMTAADRPVVNYDYDIAGRLRTISQGAETFTYGHDILSRRTSLDRPSGVRTTYSYDDLNRLTRLLHQKAGSPPIEDFQYTFNLDDEIQSITSLDSATVRPTARSVTPADAANRIPQFGSATYSFDSLGQTSSKTDSQGTTNYQWDARGRLRQVTLPNSQVVSYGYDAVGRRSTRTAGGVTTSFLYEELDVVLDRSSDGSSVPYLNGLGIDDKLRQAGEQYFLQDHLGGTAALTDAIGGVIEQTRYEAFGESLGSSLSRYGHTGRERDGASGLMYYRARWYDPTQGRFITEDPIGFEGGLNLYAYVENNPINFTDPFGLKVYRCKRPLGGKPGDTNQRNGPDIWGNPFYHEYVCVERDGKIICKGLNPSGSIWKRTPGRNNPGDVYNAENCEEIPSDDCLDKCLLKKLDDPLPDYARATRHRLSRMGG